jgi:predicted Zn-ribbon and HTH transcriptional regulator
MVLAAPAGASDDPGSMLTTPQRLREALTEVEAKTLKDLSGELSVSEKDLVPALEKLKRTLERERIKLGVEPACCLACGFEFDARERVTKPSRCPSCRSERIQPPRFYLRAKG